MNIESLFPFADDASRFLLHALQESQFAPRYTHISRDNLSAAGLGRVRDFENQLRTTPIGWQFGKTIPWLTEFVELCYAEVPYYRRYGSPPLDFFSIPTCNRDALSREPWSFVPDSLPLDDLVLYQTSGTTGHPVDILTHPVPLAMYVPLIRTALSRHQIDWEDCHGHVAMVSICFQKSTWTYVSLLRVLDHTGFVKVNLNPDDWRDTADRAKFLDDCNPQIYTGDPISFTELARLPLQTRPRALVSTSMTLLPGLRRQLEDHFDCPVIDVYSMNETGPIAVAQADGFELLHHRLYIEILDANGTPCEPGTRGEIVVSGGINPFLPLLRYRTGDFAGLHFRGQLPILVGLEGRQPMLFRGEHGQPINNIDVSTVLKPFALTQYALHQFADGSLRLRVRGNLADETALRLAVRLLFGENQLLAIEEVDAIPEHNGKVVQYTSDIHLSEESPAA